MRNSPPSFITVSFLLNISMGAILSRYFLAISASSYVPVKFCISLHQFNVSRRIFSIHGLIFFDIQGVYQYDADSLYDGFYPVYL